MGIIVPNFEQAEQGLSLPNAYVAISKNSVVLNPTSTAYDVYTSYNIWASHQAREDGKKPITMMPISINFEFSDPTTSSLNDVYAAAYTQIKMKFPGWIDEQPSA